MPNLKQRIDGYDKSTLRKTYAVPSKACNYCQPAHCSLDGNWLKSAVIYQATVTTEDNRQAESYVGLTENSFKTRYANHKSSFRDPNKILSTELNRHIWHLKDAEIEYKVTWKILKDAAPFNSASLAVICACGQAWLYYALVLLLSTLPIGVPTYQLVYQMDI